jgi:hypothetical protein
VHKRIQPGDRDLSRSSKGHHTLLQARNLYIRLENILLRTLAGFVARFRILPKFAKEFCVLISYPGPLHSQIVVSQSGSGCFSQLETGILNVLCSSGRFGPS